MTTYQVLATDSQGSPLYRFVDSTHTTRESAERRVSTLERNTRLAGYTVRAVNQTKRITPQGWDHV